MELDRQKTQETCMDIVEIVMRREEHNRMLAQREHEERRLLEAQRRAQLELDKRQALVAVRESAILAVERLNNIEWPDGFTCAMGDTTIVLTSLGMTQPLFLGSDSWVYRRENEASLDLELRTFRARLRERKSAGSILHVKQMLDKLAA